MTEKKGGKASKTVQKADKKPRARGRPKGSLSRVTRSARTAIANILDKDFTEKDIRRLIAKIEQESGAKDAFNAYIQLTDFVLPKLQRVEHTGKDGSELSIEHVLNNLRPVESFKPLPMPQDEDIIDVEPVKEATSQPVEPD